MSRHEDIESSVVQTRTEAVLSIKKRQNGDLYNLSYDLNDILFRLRGDGLPTAGGANEKNVEPTGFVPCIEKELATTDELIGAIAEKLREIRSLI